MKNVNNFQIAKIQSQGVVQSWHLLNFLPISAWGCLKKCCLKNRVEQE